MQLFGPALPCGELRPDLAVHMHVQCILNQDDSGAWIFNMKTKYFQSMYIQHEKQNLFKAWIQSG